MEIYNQLWTTVYKTIVKNARKDWELLKSRYEKKELEFFINISEYILKMSMYFVKNIKKLHSQKVTKIGKKELVQDFYKTSIRCWCIRKVLWMIDSTNRNNLIYNI